MGACSAISATTQSIKTRNFTLTDLGNTWVAPLLLSSTFPKTGDMATKQVTESQIELASSNDSQYEIMAQDEVGNPLGPTAIVGVTALVAAGAFAIVKITGNDTDGGAASPTDVVIPAISPAAR